MVASCLVFGECGNKQGPLNSLRKKTRLTKIIEVDYEQALHEACITILVPRIFASVGILVS